MGTFNTLVKAASEVVRRHEQQRHARLHMALADLRAKGILSDEEFSAKKAELLGRL